MKPSLRRNIFYSFANEVPRLRRSIVINGFLTFLIIINVLSVILQSVPELNQEYSVLFRQVEIASALIFTVEWILRVWSCVERSELA